MQGKKPQKVHTYGTDSVAALAAYNIVLFELRRSRAFAKVKLIPYTRSKARQRCTILNLSHYTYILSYCRSSCIHQK